MSTIPKEREGARQCTGRVKWYDPMKRYGFVVPDSPGPDVLIRSECLQPFGLAVLFEDIAVTMLVVEGRYGPRAVELLEIDGIKAPDRAAARASDLAGLSPEALPSAAESPLMPARVKWFDRERGYGFVNVFGVAGDVFVHMETVRQSGAVMLIEGEAIACRLAQGEKGFIAVALRPWNAAIMAGERKQGGGE
ncbi:MAG: cold shock domain-containing protein [Pseudomonadota bacterium]